MRKYHGTQLVLTVFFGPVGLFYSNVILALALIFIAFGIGVVTLGLGALLMWPVAIVAGFWSVGNYNDKLAVEEKRHDDIVRATAGRTQ